MTNLQKNKDNKNLKKYLVSLIKEIEIKMKCHSVKKLENI